MNLNDNGSSSSASRIFVPVSLSIIPKRESQTWTMIATTASGLRMYFSTTGNTPGAYNASISGNQQRASKLVLCHVKAPPDLRKANNNSQQRNSFQNSSEYLESQNSWHCADASLFAAYSQDANGGGSDFLIGALSDFSAHPDVLATNVNNRNQAQSIQGKRAAHSTEVVHTLNQPNVTLPGGRVWEIVGEFDSSASCPSKYSRAQKDSAPKALPAPFVAAPIHSENSGFGISSILRGEYNSPAPKRQKTAKSYTVRGQVSQKDILPLPTFSTRVTPKRILVLTTGSLHIFTYRNVWDILYQTILSSSSNKLKEWVAAYGGVETVCMIVHVASVYNELYAGILNKCVDLIIEYGCVHPKPMLNDSTALHTTGVSTVGQNSSYQLAWPSQDNGYTPSILQNAFHLNAARILRSVWQTPAVVCENKKEVTIISEEICNQAQRQIAGMIKIMKRGLSDVVQTDPFDKFTSTEIPNNDMDVDDKSDWITRRQTPIQHRPQVQLNGNQNHINGSRACHINSSKQKQMEREILHSLYRLLTRTNHLLSLLRILRYSSKQDINLQWGQLHNISIADLVCNPAAQERIDLLLDAFLMSDETNQAVLEQLQRQCYLYYSQGTRYVAVGYSSDNDLSAAKWFRLAARYWKRYDISLICMKY